MTSTKMRRAIAIAALLLVAAGLGLRHQEILGAWTGLRAAAPKTAYVVIASADLPKLPQATLDWLQSSDFAASVKPKIYRVDPDVLGPDGKTPPELAPIIARAKKAGLPRVVLVGPKGGLVDAPLPKDAAAAKKLLGVK